MNSRLILVATAAITMAVSPVIGTSQAYAVGLPMFQQGVENRQAMQKLLASLKASLAKNSAGIAAIDGGSCGYTLREFYRDVREKHPEIGLAANPTKEDYASFIEYVGSLQLIQLSESGDYYNSRRVKTAEGCSSDLNWSKVLPKGQWVWADRNTGNAIFKGNCGNILAEKEPKERCVDIVAPLNKDDDFYHGVAGNRRLPPSACTAIKMPGETKFRRISPPCPRLYCDNRRLVAEIGMPSQHESYEKAKVKGEVTIRLPAVVAESSDFRAWLCIKRNGIESYGIGIMTGNYLPSAATVEIAKVAQVYRSPELIPTTLGPGHEHMAWRPRLPASAGTN